MSQLIVVSTIRRQNHNWVPGPNTELSLHRAYRVEISGGRNFHKAGATAEKVCILDSINWYSLTGGTGSIPNLLDQIIKGKKGNRWSLK